MSKAKSTTFLYIIKHFYEFILIIFFNNKEHKDLYESVQRD